MIAVGVGLAWVAMTATAFLALSATATARGRKDLETDAPADADAQDLPGEHLPARQAPREHGHGHWPDAAARTTVSLRSSPSAAYMHARAPERPSPIRAMTARSGPLGLR
jgi:hypothetical protein